MPIYGGQEIGFKIVLVFNLLQMYKTAGWSVGAEYAKYSVLCFVIFIFLSVAFH